MGPPNPGLVITPTPSPEKLLDDFNPMYVQPDTNWEGNFDQPEASIYNSRSVDERIIFPYTATADLLIEKDHEFSLQHKWQPPLQNTYKWKEMAQKTRRWALVLHEIIDNEEYEQSAQNWQMSRFLHLYE